MRKNFSAADFFEGMWIVVRAIVLFAMMCFGLYLLKSIKIPFLVTIPLLAVYITFLCINMIKIGVHIMLHGYYECD